MGVVEGGKGSVSKWVWGGWVNRGGLKIFPGKTERAKNFSPDGKKGRGIGNCFQIAGEFFASLRGS